MQTFFGERPVSLTSIACKLLESFLRNTLIEYMKDNHLINRKQFGFLTGRSTVLQLLQVMDKWTEICINIMVKIDCVSYIYLYADDTKIFHEINSSADKEELQ